MSLIQTPRTSKGLLIALGVLALIVVWLYATTMLTVALGALVIGVLLYAVYLIGVRIHRFLRDARIFGRGGGA